ncbi:hypothetical protein GOODEAATRI_015997, partial [Goodea atripinnis]
LVAGYRAGNFKQKSPPEHRNNRYRAEGRSTGAYCSGITVTERLRRLCPTDPVFYWKTLHRTGKELTLLFNTACVKIQRKTQFITRLKSGAIDSQR